MAFLSPTGRKSRYRYQYRGGQQNDVRIARNDIVVLRGGNEHYTVRDGNGLDVENPGVWIISLDTRQRKLVRASALQLICNDRYEECECMHHLKWAEFEEEGPFHANIIAGRSRLERGDEPEVSLDALIEKVRALTVTNRNRLNRFVDELI